MRGNGGPTFNGTRLNCFPFFYSFPNHTCQGTIFFDNSSNGWSLFGQYWTKQRILARVPARGADSAVVAEIHSWVEHFDLVGIGGVANHWRLKYTEVQSQQMAFTQSPSLRNNPKILNNDSTVPSLQMTLYVFGFVLCFVIKMTTIFDLMSQGWSVLWWGWWKFGDETDDNDQIDDKRKISPVDGPWQPSRLCTNLGRDTLTTHFRKYRYLFGELPKLARLSLWGLLLYTS